MERFKGHFTKTLAWFTPEYRDVLSTFPRGDHQSDSWEARLKLCLDMFQLQLTMVSSSKYVSTSGVLEVWGTPQTKQV